jgi:hypothetical protein
MPALPPSPVHVVPMADALFTVTCGPISSTQADEPPPRLAAELTVIAPLMSCSVASGSARQAAWLVPIFFGHDAKF